MESSIITILQKINSYLVELEERIKNLEEQTKKQDLLLSYLFLHGNYDIEEFKRLHHF